MRSLDYVDSVRFTDHVEDKIKRYPVSCSDVRRRLLDKDADFYRERGTWGRYDMHFPDSQLTFVIQLNFSGFDRMVEVVTAFDVQTPEDRYDGTRFVKVGQ